MREEKTGRKERNGNRGSMRMKRTRRGSGGKSCKDKCNGWERKQRKVTEKGEGEGEEAG